MQEPPPAHLELSQHLELSRDPSDPSVRTPRKAYGFEHIHAASPHHLSSRHPGVLPHKFLVAGLTPPADQMLRGNCYLFSLTGIVEDSYRRYGVARGWWAADEYLRLSRQAF